MDSNIIDVGKLRVYPQVDINCGRIHFTVLAVTYVQQTVL